ncbi:hypothetical protein ACMATS_19960 [Streptoverticillium reticulum]|uniref:hypothetical protein n=1 Tax=Streptoverticillium reticulum TaxID=1433415 RepID=UPI0039BFA8A1
MQRKIKHLEVRSTMVMAISAAALVISQGLAFADTTGWSVPGNNTSIAAGSHVSLNPQWSCRQGPCDYDQNSVFRIGAVNGASLDAGTAPNLVTNSSGTQVGTCTLDSGQLLCSPTSSGTVGSGDALTLDSSVSGFAASSTCTESFYVDWFDSNNGTPDQSQEGTGQVQDWDNSGQCGG